MGRQIKTVLLTLFLLFSAGVQSAKGQTPVPLGMEDVVWQKEGLYVWSLAFSPTQPYVAVGTDQNIKIFSTVDGSEIITLNTRVDDFILALEFSQDGQYLYSGSKWGQLVQWNTISWDSITCIDYYNSNNVKSIGQIDISQSRNYIAVAGRSEGMFIYNVDTKQIIDHWSDMPIVDQKLGDRAVVNTVSFRNDGKVIAIGMIAADETWLYDLDTKQIIKKIKGEDGLYSPTKNELIVKKILKQDNGAQLLDGLDYYKFDESENPKNLNINELSAQYTLFDFNSFGNKIIVAGAPSFKIKIFNIDIFSLSNIIEEPKLGGHLSVSSDNKYLLTLGGTGQLYLVNIEKYTDVKETEIIQSLIISPNPTNDILNIEYSLTKNNNIHISLTDLQGIFLGEIFSGYQESGVHNINYPIANLPSSAYFINIDVNGSISSKKFEIIR